MKKVMMFLMALFFAFAGTANAATFAIVLQYLMGQGTGATGMIGVGYGIVDSVTQKYETRVIMEISVPLDSPITWKAAIVQAMITDAALGGYTLPVSNIRWLALEPGDYKDTRPAATWDKDKTFVNIPAAYTNVYAALGGEQKLVDFSGYTQYRFTYTVQKIGNTGTHTAALVDAANAANVIALDDATATLAEHGLDSGWTNLPAWAVGEKIVKPMAKDALATGDDIYHGFDLYLR